MNTSSLYLAKTTINHRFSNFSKATERELDWQPPEVSLAPVAVAAAAAKAHHQLCVANADPVLGSSHIIDG